MKRSRFLYIARCRWETSVGPGIAWWFKSWDESLSFWRVAWCGRSNLNLAIGSNSNRIQPFV